MRVVVKNHQCTGCLLCASLWPDAFDMGDEGIAIPRHKVVPSWMEEQYRNAVDSCPEQAIQVFEQV